MSKKKKNDEVDVGVKLRKTVGIDRVNGRWGTVTFTFEEGTDTIVSREFEPCLNNYSSAAVIQLESAIEKSGMVILED
jgi:hypothetical protein